MNSLLARSFVAFVAALVTWAGAPSSMAGAIPSSATSTSSVYTYDGQHPVAGPTLAGPDRGPPTNEPVSSSSSVGRLGSKAASAHQYAAVTLASHDYPDLAPFTRAASRGGAAVQASRTACPVGGERLGVAANAGAKGFGALTKAGNYGVWPYRTLKADLKGTGLEAHHLIEQRFAGVMGQSVGDMASVAVTKAEHQAFTNAWRQAIPYGDGTANATPAQIRSAASQIYADYPDILSALGLP